MLDYSWDTMGKTTVMSDEESWVIIGHMSLNRRWARNATLAQLLVQCQSNVGFKYLGCHNVRIIKYKQHSNLGKTIGDYIDSMRKLTLNQHHIPMLTRQIVQPIWKNYIFKYIIIRYIALIDVKVLVTLIWYCPSGRAYKPI